MNLLISDEVQKDIQHHSRDTSEEYNKARKKYKKFGGHNSNKATVLYPVKVDANTPSTDNVATVIMPTIFTSCLFCDPMAVARNKIPKEKATTGHRSRVEKPTHTPNRYNEDVHVDNQYHGTSNSDASDKHRKREIPNEDSTTTIGNLKVLKRTPLRSINRNKEGKIPTDLRDDRYQPKPKFKSENSFRIYFSRHTPDLRFRRDLSGLLRSPLGQVDHVTLNLHHVVLDDEAMYECQVKPLGAPAKWGRAELNVHGMNSFVQNLYVLAFSAGG